jgi:hypothetical protein
MLLVSQQTPISDPASIDTGITPQEPEVWSAIPVELAPELRKKLQQILESPDFEVSIPRVCMIANLIKEKLKAIPPDQRLPRLEKLMRELGLELVVLIDPKDSTAILARVNTLVAPASNP